MSILPDDSGNLKNQQKKKTLMPSVSENYFPKKLISATAYQNHQEDYTRNAVDVAT